MSGELSHDEMERRLLDVADRLDIDFVTVEELGALAGYDIVCLCDDSAQMNEPVYVATDEQSPAAGGAKNSTRWGELKAAVGAVVDLATCLDTDGIELRFLLRTGAQGVTSTQQASPHFDADPTAPVAPGTLLNAIKSAFESHIKATAGQANAKKLLLIVASGFADMAPEVSGATAGAKPPREELMSVLGDRDVTKSAVMLLMCNDVYSIRQVVNGFDRAVPGLDVLDDYVAEKDEVIRAGRTQAYSRGDHYARALLGAISERWGHLDETAASDIPPWWTLTITRTLKVIIHSAANLAPMDSNGFSDPFVQVNVGDMRSKQVKKTKIIKKTLNPTWDETLEFKGPFNTSTASVTLQVFDKDMIGADQIGIASLSLNDTLLAGRRTHQLTHYGKRFRFQDVGNVTVSFEWKE